MQHKLGSLLMAILLISLSQSTTLAQIYQVNSPYSRIGIGTKLPGVYTSSRAMGGISVAYRPLTKLNYANPASYSALSLTTFETAINAEGLWLQDNSTAPAQTSGSSSLAYLGLGFPVTKYWGSSFGILPYSRLNYDIQVNTQKEDIGLVEQFFVGEGQLYQFYWGNGFKYKRFSAGFNLGYLFGTYRQQSRLFFPILDDSSDFGNNGYTLGTQRNEEFSVGGFQFNLGLQYRHSINDNLQLIGGITGDLPLSVGAERILKWEKLNANSTNTNVLDTILSINQEKNNLQLPPSLGAGITLQKGADWLVGLDLKWEGWDSFEKFGRADSSLVSSIRIGAGIEFAPDANSYGKFWKRTRYRFGGYYNTGHIQIGNQNISEFAVTAGLGLPMRRISSLNISLEAGQRGSITDNLLRETFFQATFGISLNDKWFQQRKYD